MSGLSTRPEADERAVYGSYGPAERPAWLDLDWRSRQRWVILDGQPINVIELGEGPPLVFIHGLIGRWTHWMEQLARFASSHRVIALDLPGFGHSPMPKEKISVVNYARMVEQLLERLEIDAAALVGHSMGAFTAAELAINFPQRVERLVLISPAGLSTYNNPRALRFLAQLRRFEHVIAAYNAWVASHADILARRARMRLLEPALSLVTHHPDRLPAPFAAEFLRGLGTEGFLDGTQANLNYDFRDRLGEIVCPTLIVWGARDRVVSARDATLFEQLIGDSRKVVLEDTGHMAMIERPAAFNALLEDFLSA
jgi:pimeloyl-ACP methyl ester carboxylesterase